jgi:hypothetical protein
MACLGDSRVPCPCGEDNVGYLGVAPMLDIGFGLEAPESFVRGLGWLAPLLVGISDRPD